MNGSTASVTRLDVSGQADLGIFATQGTHLTGSDINLRGLTPGVGRRAGTGIALGSRTEAEFERVQMRDVTGPFVFADGVDTTLLLQDFDGSNNHAIDAPPSHRVAFGITANTGAHIRFTRSLLQLIRGFGVFATNEASIEVDEVIVDGVDVVVPRPSDEADTAAFVASQYGNLTLGRFAARNAVECGIAVWQPRSLEVGVGRIEHCGIGVCIWEEPMRRKRATFNSSATKPTSQGWTRRFQRLPDFDGMLRVHCQPMLASALSALGKRAAHEASL